MELFLQQMHGESVRSLRYKVFNDIPLIAIERERSTTSKDDAERVRDSTQVVVVA